MPLFVCDKCRAVESTATSTFSRQLEQRALGARKHILCSECDTGAWHGLFQKTTATPKYLAEHAHEFIYTGRFAESVRRSDADEARHAKFRLV
jgi:hypothetical protein